MKVILTDEFVEELGELFVWLAENHSARAFEIVQEIRTLCDVTLANKPGIGSYRPSLGPGVRGFHSARHNRTIFYRIDEEREAIVFLHLRYNQDTKPKDFSE